MRKSIIISFALLALSLGANAQEATAEKPLAFEAEVGIVAANGNTKSESYLGKGGVAYKFDAYLAKLTGSYLKNESHDYKVNTVTNYEKWDVGVRFEREITTKFSVYVGQNAESDKDAGAIRRYNTDVGGKYFIAKKEDYYTFTELGYRFASEEYTDGTDAEIHFARLYVESEKFWKPTLSTKLWAEYLPNVEDSEDYGVNGEFSVNAALDNVFSIKTAYLAKYTNLPVTPYRTDTLFSTSLIAKF